MKVALLWHGDREARDTVRLDEHRLGPTAAALRNEGLEPVAAVYNDDFADEVKAQLLSVDAVQVWVNPLEGERTRAKLDAMLLEVAAADVLVSAHPDTILKMGTKQVLYDTREMGWGSDVCVYTSPEELKAGLSGRIAEGRPRVLKQYRGHSGDGIWKVTPHPTDPSRVLARHAARGSTEQELSWDELLANFAPYFKCEGRMIDQAYQDRIGEGMVRCYLVQNRIQGFGHQAVNALHPSEPQPGARLYHPPTTSDFQSLKEQMEAVWLPQLLAILGMSRSELPMLWDADFMLGPKTFGGEDTYVLCEINVSSVYPYPESAMAPLARAIRARIA